MYDIHLEWGADLAVGRNGDLAAVNALTYANQRVLRRLLTNPGDYIWNLDYGGGLARFVGSTVGASDIEAVIRDQMSFESIILSSPAPDIEVQTISTVGGYVVADITYSVLSSGSPLKLNLSLSSST